MIRSTRCIKLLAIVVWGLATSRALAQQLNQEQMQLINNMAASICNSVKEAKGEQTEYQLQGAVKAQLSGLLGKFVDTGASGKGTANRGEFEGLSRDATAAALEGDRGCRERVFDRMFDRLIPTAAAPAAPQRPIAKLTMADAFARLVGGWFCVLKSDELYFYFYKTVTGYAFKMYGHFKSATEDYLVAQNNIKARWNLVDDSTKLRIIMQDGDLVFVRGYSENNNTGWKEWTTDDFELYFDGTSLRGLVSNSDCNFVRFDVYKYGPEATNSR